jgi:hypothetical protein
MSTPTTCLNQNQIESYHEQGYLKLNRITSEEEIEELREVCERLFLDTDRQDRKQLGDVDPEEGETLPQINSPHEMAPELLETQYYDNALAIAQQLLGEEAQFDFDHAIRKPARSGAETPWHQDEAYWNPECTTRG